MQLCHQVNMDRASMVDKMKEEVVEQVVEEELGEEQELSVEEDQL